MSKPKIIEDIETLQTNLNLVQSDVAAIDSLLNSDVLIKRGVPPANFNDAVNPGAYVYGVSGYTNAPRSGYGGILVVFATTNNSWRAQLCFDHDNLYYRLLYSGAWRQWRLISAQAL